MGRFLVLLILATLLGLAIDRTLGRLASRLRGSDPRGAHGRGAAGPPAITETLVRCQRCGVHVPRSRTVTDAEGRVFCSDRCRSAGLG